MPHVMTPLGSASNMILSNAILTEGLTYSFYLFFSVELILRFTGRGGKRQRSSFPSGTVLGVSASFTAQSDDDYLVHLGHCSRVCCIDTDKDRETENFCQLVEFWQQYYWYF